RTHLEPRRPLPPRRHRDARLPRRDRALRRGRHPRHGARCLLGQPRDRAGPGPGPRGPHPARAVLPPRAHRPGSAGPAAGAPDRPRRASPDRGGAAPLAPPPHPARRTHRSPGAMRARKPHAVLSVDWVRLELLRTAFSTRGGLFSRMDPRMVIAWYLVMALAPWFTHNLTVLIGFFALGVLSVILARVGPLVLGLFVIGLGADVIALFAAAFLFGGDATTLIALAELNLKLGAVSMASMSAFVSLDPEKLSDALLALRAPELLAFGVSYGYRMLPILVDEYVTVFEGQRL